VGYSKLLEMDDLLNLTPLELREHEGCTVVIDYNCKKIVWVNGVALVAANGDFPPKNLNFVESLAVVNLIYHVEFL
jgi:hypothetical protein